MTDAGAGWLDRERTPNGAPKLFVPQGGWLGTSHVGSEVFCGLLRAPQECGLLAGSARLHVGGKGLAGVPVGCVGARRDEREAHARQGLHAKAAQHSDVRVASADQHNILCAPRSQELRAW